MLTPPPTRKLFNHHKIQYQEHGKDDQTRAFAHRAQHVKTWESGGASVSDLQIPHVRGFGKPWKLSTAMLSGAILSATDPGRALPAAASNSEALSGNCLLYTSDAADDTPC
eukprot:949258-Amphidinium_carterae.1